MGRHFKYRGNKVVTEQDATASRALPVLGLNANKTWPRQIKISSYHQCFPRFFLAPGMEEAV